ncbi:MAG: hypothetical protein RSC49_02130 [Clostridium sp.]
MGRINSRNKGSRNERNLSKWWEKWTGFEFGRVPSSGGLRWNRTTDTTGDIICTNQKHFLRFPFSIEAKDYKDINFEHILLGTKGCKVLQFWEQAKGDAERGKKLPILMMRYNGMKKDEYFFIVNKEFGNILYDRLKHLGNFMIIKSGLTDLVIFMASDVLTLNYKEIYKEAKAYLKSKK